MPDSLRSLVSYQGPFPIKAKFQNHFVVDLGSREDKIIVSRRPEQLIEQVQE